MGHPHDFERLGHYGMVRCRRCPLHAVDGGPRIDDCPIEPPPPEAPPEPPPEPAAEPLSFEAALQRALERRGL